MRKAICWIVFLSLFLAIGGCSKIGKEEKQVSQSSKAAATFDLKYRGLDENWLKGDMMTRWNGFSSSNVADTPFAKSLNLPAGKAVYGKLYPFPKLGSIVLEMDENKPITLYMDFNGDGKLSDGEKIMPLDKSKSQYLPWGSDSVGFITPDLRLQSDGNGNSGVAVEKGNSFPYRLIIVARENNIMFSPFCFLEGTGTIDGTSYHLILADCSWDGVFTEFGTDQFTLATDAQYERRQFQWHPLSSLICQDKKFYRVRLSKEKAVFVPNMSPQGTLKLAVLSKPDVDVKTQSIRIAGTENESAVFEISNMGKTLDIPIGRYKLEQMSLSYGDQDGQWSTYCSNGSEFSVKSHRKTIVKVGQPTMKVKAVNQRRRYNAEGEKNATVFQQGVVVFLSPEVTGASGEKYGAFYKQSRNQENNDPRVVIKDTDGKEVASGTMPFG